MVRSSEAATRRFCSRACSAREQSLRARGSLTKAGYRVLSVDGEVIKEHRLIVENILGRKLQSSENVHHKNGKRDDNRLKNLELWASSQPSGQQPAHLVAWAREILYRYATEVEDHPETLGA